MTFSIVAHCPLTGQLGVAVSTAVPAVGAQVSADGFRIVTTNAQGQYTIDGVQSGDLLLRFVDPVTQYAVNTPVNSAPTMPQTPWMPKTSSESSARR